MQNMLSDHNGGKWKLITEGNLGKFTDMQKLITH